MLVLGIVLFLLGLAASIAWHELGHFVAAKRFGIRVPEFMVGFGPTVFSWRRGETRFGLKALPLGGFIRMIGMIPPAPGERIGRSRRSGPLQGLIDDVRAESVRDFVPGDENRQFWTRKPWQRIVVMLAGPAQNLLLAIVLFVVVLMGFGVVMAQPVVGQLSPCITPASADAAGSGCPPGATPSPAALAGFRPGDRIVTFDGRSYPEWDDLSAAIRSASGTVPVVVDRGGTQVTLYPTLVRTQLLAPDSYPDDPTYVDGSVLGFRPTGAIERLGPGQVADRAGEMLAGTLHSISRLPQKVPALFGAVFLGEQRDVYGPVSVVGVSVIGGEALASDNAIAQEIAFMINLLALVNLSLCVLNLLPILPLDGGHVLPALWEAGKKRLARLRGRPDPGPVDMAKLMPIAYGFAVVIMCYGGLVIIADIVNPIKLPL